VKALTQFPSVLASLDKNLSWAPALGDAYVNQQRGIRVGPQCSERQQTLQHGSRS